VFPINGSESVVNPLGGHISCILKGWELGKVKKGAGSDSEIHGNPISISDSEIQCA